MYAYPVLIIFKQIYRVNLEVLVIKGYSTLVRASEQEPHNGSLVSYPGHLHFVCM